MHLNRKTSPCASTADDGFTMIEILIAMSIFAVGILAVATMQTTAINGNSTARKHTEATICLSDRVEALMAMPYKDALLDDSVHHTADAGQGVITYTTEWDVSNEADFKKVTVTVSWRDRGTDKSKAITFIKPQDI